MSADKRNERAGKKEEAMNEFCPGCHIYKFRMHGWSFKRCVRTCAYINPNILINNAKKNRQRKRSGIKGGK